ncbi:MAG: protein kinase domain-containing protein [Gemmatimonadaceae bacterium]
MTCPACHAPVPPGTKFCNECGARVAAEALRDAVAGGDPLRDGIERALAAQYDIVRLLGRGGMGAVYLARDRALERAVAIKVLPPDAAAAGDGLERFKREARTVASLTHPNIVPLYAFGEAARDGGPALGYYVMGYVRGESLAARLARDGRLPADETRRVLAELADALDYAHRQGVVHRDIKPDNVLLDDASGRPMLTDFGIAKGRDVGKTLTQVGTVMGTPHYMAPEQAAGDRDVDGRSDLYSLGVLGYAMLAGRVPFDGKNLHEILLQHVTAPPPPLSAYAPDAPEDLVAAIERCLEKDPAARWPDGKSLRQALGGDEGKELPRELEPLAGTGLLLVLAAATPLYVLLVALVRGWFESRPNLTLFWTLYPITLTWGVLAEARRARKDGFGWRRILRVIFWQPKWWPFAWPARLRRPGDLTPRLPKGARRLRAMFTSAVVVVTLPLLFLPMLGPLTETPARHEPLLPGAAPLAWAARWQAMVWLIPMMACSFGGGALMLAAFAGAQLWGRRRGLPMYVRTRVPGAALASSFWQRPEVQTLLLPLPDAAGAAREPQTPHELLRSVADAADGLAGPARSVGAEAVAAARELLADFEAVEHELAELGTSLDPAELERLDQRIAALDAQGSELDERRQLRALLSTQRDLLQRVQARHGAAWARREALLGMLRSLWTQLADLRARSAAGTVTPEITSEISARVRALLQELARTAGPRARGAELPSPPQGVKV